MATALSVYPALRTLKWPQTILCVYVCGQAS